MKKEILYNSLKKKWSGKITLSHNGIISIVDVGSSKDKNVIVGRLQKYKDKV